MDSARGLWLVQALSRHAHRAVRGQFPWLSACQVKSAPRLERVRDYAGTVAQKLRDAGVRVKVDGVTKMKP